MNSKLKKLFGRAEKWPLEAEEKAIEKDIASAHDLSIEDREALERSADDVRRGQFASDAEVKDVLGRFRTG